MEGWRRTWGWGGGFWVVLAGGKVVFWLWLLQLQMAEEGRRAEGSEVSERIVDLQQQVPSGWQDLVGLVEEEVELARGSISWIVMVLSSVVVLSFSFSFSLRMVGSLFERDAEMRSIVDSAEEDEEESAGRSSDDELPQSSVKLSSHVT